MFPKTMTLLNVYHHSSFCFKPLSITQNDAFECFLIASPHFPKHQKTPWIHLNKLEKLLKGFVAFQLFEFKMD